MATTIGAQLVAKLEEVMNAQRVMNSLATIGPDLRRFEDFQCFAHVVEFVEGIQNEKMDDLNTFLVRNVAPIVSHINDGL